MAAVFFTHCHPARIIIHKPSFSTALSHNQVPQYLIHAICALAAPLSKQPRIRTHPARFAGKRFAQEAMSIMFDGAGRVICAPNLATAQALCLLQIHDIITKDKNMRYNTRYHGTTSSPSSDVSNGAQISPFRSSKASEFTTPIIPC